MTVLMITGHPPWPAVSGGRRREAELLARLADRVPIEVCAVDKEAPAGTARPLAGGPVGGQVFGARPPSGSSDLEARHRSPGAADWIEARLDQGDISLIHCEGYFLRQLLPSSVDPPIVIGAQNVEWELVEQRLRLTDVAPAETAATVAHHQCRELGVLRAANAVVCVTDRDAALLRHQGLAPIVIPDGCDHLPVAEATHDRVDLLIPGNYAYAPNRDAATAFGADLLPELLRQRPSTTVRFVGNQAFEQLAHLARPGVEVVGPVDSMAPHLAAARVVVVPLRIGGGIKVKVLEALHAGRAIVCSSIGATGFDDHAGALIVAERWSDIVPRTLELLDRPAYLAAQGRLATRYARELPCWDEAADRLERAWRAARLPSATKALAR